MSALRKPDLITADDYLASELASPIKREYLGGVVYAMSGANNVHNRIATNALGILYVALGKRRCQPFNSDTKIRVRLPTHVRFYYPDAMVVCRPNPPQESFQDEPAAIFEVLSRSTRRTDEGEKRDAYCTIGSLCIYALIEQDLPAVTVFRRTDQGFVREVYEGLDAIVSMPEIDAELPLAQIYAGVEFTPEVGEEP